jgi:hypothetical protein
MSLSRENKEYYPGEWDLSLTNLQRLTSGNGSLRVAFWGIWVIIPAFLLLVVYTITALLSNTNFVEVVDSYETQHILIIFIYQVFFAFRIVWINTICNKKYWIPVSRIFIIVTIVNNIFIIYPAII